MNSNSSKSPDPFSFLGSNNTRVSSESGSYSHESDSSGLDSDATIPSDVDVNHNNQVNESLISPLATPQVVPASASHEIVDPFSLDKSGSTEQVAKQAAQIIDGCEVPDTSKWLTRSNRGASGENRTLTP